MTYQHVTIVGNVGRDPEFRYTPQGVAVADFSVAVSKVTGKGEEKKEKTTWFKVTVWRERAEIVSQYVKKGMKILVTGEIEAEAYLDKSGQPAASLKLTANDFKFLDSKADTEQRSANRGSSSSRGGEDHVEDVNDIPF